MDRAFAKLDTIKDDVVWWEAGAQPPQLLADGEVVMTTAYNGRIFAAAVDEGKPFQIVWDGQIYENEMFVDPEGRAEQGRRDGVHRVRHLDRRSARSGRSRSPTARPASRRWLIEIIFKDGKTVMAPHLPTAPENLTNALVLGLDFWVDHDAELNERFNAWLAAVI